ncbi:hypothetical protein [Rufibacter soli]
MKTLCTLSFLFFLTIRLAAYGQGNRNEDELGKNLKSERLAEIATTGALKQEALVSQQGTGNNGVISQRNLSSRSNVAFLVQVGAYNTASIQQQGEGNRATARQVGTNNSYMGQIIGVNNLTNVHQQGSSNSINQRVEGNNLEYTLIQLGNHNSINQIETAPTSRPYQVIQQGNNMNITIEQSNWGLPPVTVTKK